MFADVICLVTFIIKDFLYKSVMVYFNSLRVTDELKDDIVYVVIGSEENLSIVSVTLKWNQTKISIFTSIFLVSIWPNIHVQIFFRTILQFIRRCYGSLAVIYLSKVSNGNIKTVCKIHSNLAIKMVSLFLIFTCSFSYVFSNVSFVDLGQVTVSLVRVHNIFWNITKRCVKRCGPNFFCCRNNVQQRHWGWQWSCQTIFWHTWYCTMSCYVEFEAGES